MNVLDDEYFMWLNEKLDKYKKLTTIDEKISIDERKSIIDLFDRVDDYVKKYYYFNTKQYGYIYDISHNNDLYEIEKIYGPSVLYQIKRENNALSYIDVKEIQDGKIRGIDNVEVYYHMKNIMDSLNRLGVMGVPMNDVQEVVDNKILTLKRRNNGFNSNK